MKILLLTVAGTSTRFSKSIDRCCLKCIFYEKDFSESLLYKMVRKNSSFDKIIIVGGYKFEELKLAIDENFADLNDKIILVENPYFEEYGSGYSLYVGLNYALKFDFDELIFAEGDLWIDDESFEKVLSVNGDVVTYNRETIFSDKAVVFYFDISDKVHYLYDTAHKYLEIKEPFLSIYNSAQIWKFASLEHVKIVYEKMTEADWHTTNLMFIQKYFGDTNRKFALIEIKKWLNCNTIQDFKRIGKI